ncbi:MAG: hypothetical protein Q8P30_01265 [Candidatus Uhrbacteria bacterium]|nr:hypothetical protein [Candidatus Uhrbacteria bacterium]
MIKKLIILPLFAMLLLPTNSNYALAYSDDSLNTLIDNIGDIESLDFSIDLDFETVNEKFDNSLTMHADIDGAWDSDANGKFDLFYWSEDQNGLYNEFSGSMIATPDRVYISNSDEIWYFIEGLTTEQYQNQQQIDSTTESTKELFQMLFDEGVIKYNFEGIDYIDHTITAKYSYSIDTDKLIDSMATHGVVTDTAEIEEVRVYLSENVVIDGYLWVDTSSVQPKMFTLEIDNHTNDTTYTTSRFSILFNSINEPVQINVPKDAIDIKQYSFQDTEDLVISSVENTIKYMDTDGDGLTDWEETETWHTSVINSDSDGDGYKDQTEVINGYDPNGYGKLDSDADGLTDYAEMTIHWTDRYNSDTDGDGYNDGLEIANGYDPNGKGRW